MWSRIVLLLCLAFGGWQSGFAGVVRIADGDCAGLASAVSAVQASESATILLARGGTYRACGVIALTGNVLIDGQGATFQFLTAYVDHVATMTIRNASITSLPSDANASFFCTSINDLGGLTGYAWGAICNKGTLNLDSVSVHDIDQTGFYHNSFGSPYVVNLVNFIGSDGTLILRNVTVANNRGRFLSGTGVAEIYNLTVSASNTQPFLNAQVSGVAGQILAVKIANSLFASSAGPACVIEAGAATITSAGGNVATESSCGISPVAGDRVVADAQLASFGNHGGLLPTQAINSGSPAKGAGVAQYCEALDARGYTRSPHGCDAGAYEYGGGSGALTASGLNGFYFDADANGHYVSLQRIHDNGDIAIVWSTFDSNGNPAWVYGVGQLAGKRIHASMSQNLGGVLQPGGAPTGSSVHRWGTVDIDLTSCALAQFNYASSEPGFGSGTFPLTRLAFVSDFGCSE